MAQKNSDYVVIKKYGNRRLYNTETSNYVTYQDLVKIIRDGHDIRVIDSKTKEDVTKSILMQLILEEEKQRVNLLPLSFLFQLLRTREELLQDFFRNHLATSLEAYLKTKEEFDRRFREMMNMTTTPQMWEKFIPGTDAMREIWFGGEKEEKSDKEE
ncbi:MAG TPA: polyhydroxyalkanoate synthesis repressor PhaR [Pyrinomonadaceae bacterium]|jgi:polyhydroxyalkanoate synthesis repressor PhaR